MGTRTVTTQAELDQAIADGVEVVYVNSPAGVWLSVTASGSSRVVARDSSRVEAGRYVAVHLWSQRVTLNAKGAVIDMTTLDLTQPDQWVEYHGVRVDVGDAIVYKAVGDDLCSERGMVYPIGETVTAADWKPTAACGNGLHFGVSPRSARQYFLAATRFLACAVDAAGLIALDDKCKAESCQVLYEVDIDGEVVR